MFIRAGAGDNLANSVMIVAENGFLLEWSNELTNVHGAGRLLNAGHLESLLHYAKVGINPRYFVGKDTGRAKLAANIDDLEPLEGIVCLLRASTGAGSFLRG